VDAEEVGDDRGWEPAGELQQRGAARVVAVDADPFHAVTEDLLADRA
jgi:hypothetical protein